MYAVYNISIGKRQQFVNIIHVYGTCFNCKKQKSIQLEFNNGKN